jgi:hypothetical protein
VQEAAALDLTRQAQAPQAQEQAQAQAQAPMGLYGLN